MNNEKNHSTFNTKPKASVDTSSIRSTSTMSSLKKLLPKKVEYKVDRERNASDRAVRDEARASYFANK
jgi:hypothetical protein